MIGYAFCGSFCTFSSSLEALEGLLKKGYEIQPILSDIAYSTDTQFWKCTDFVSRVEDLCKRKIIHSIVDAEPLGPQKPLDAMIIAPCTGNTLAKIANGITDSSVSMAAKAHLRADRPLLIALASNDAMSSNLKNIATLLQRKHVFFVPMLQDSPDKKPHSLVADFSRIEDSFENALKGHQCRKIFL